jgi:hypothetical protein
MPARHAVSDDLVDWEDLGTSWRGAEWATGRCSRSTRASETRVVAGDGPTGPWDIVRRSCRRAG